MRKIEMTLRIDQTQKAKLVKASKKNKVSIAEIIRNLIEKYL